MLIKITNFCSLGTRDHAAPKSRVSTEVVRGDEVFEGLARPAVYCCDGCAMEDT